jgi:hypothetical protein
MITRSAEIEGMGKAGGGWFDVRQVRVSYDHPFKAPFDHAFNIDFVNDDLDLGKRVAVELSFTSAKSLLDALHAVLAEIESTPELGT